MKALNLIIRRCSKKDLRKALELFRKTTAEPPDGSNWTEREASRFLGRFYKIDSGGCYVALTGNKIIGGLFGCRYYWKDIPTYQLEEIFVSPEFRRKGVGRALFKSVVRSFKRKTIVWLYANKKNLSVKFYKSLGMKVQTYVVIMGRKYGKKNG